jgi:hypothetical protein
MLLRPMNRGKATKSINGFRPRWNIIVNQPAQFAANMQLHDERDLLVWEIGRLVWPKLRVTALRSSPTRLWSRKYQRGERKRRKEGLKKL